MRKALTLLLLFMCAASFSQIKFEPGYFIDNNGSKASCLIRNLAWKNNPASFEYKTDESSATATGTISNIREFSVSGYTFRRHIVDIDRSSASLQSMDINKEPKFLKETLFLKVLVEGKATLFSYEDGNLIRFFFTDENSVVPQQLVHKQYLVDGAVAQNNQFRVQLFNSMKSILSKVDRFKNVDYTEEDLVKIFTEYGGVEGKESTNFTTDQNRSTFHLKVTGGVNFTQLKIFYYDGTENVTLQEEKPVVAPGLEAEVVLPFNNRKWSLFVNPSYQQFNSLSSVATSNANINNEWKIEYKFIDMPIGVRHYMFLTNKAKLFIDAAFVLGINLGNSRAEYKYFRHGTYFVQAAEISQTSNFAFGAGFSYTRFSAAARLNLNRSVLSNYALWDSEYTSVGVILAYRIF